MYIKNRSSHDTQSNKTQRDYSNPIDNFPVLDFLVVFVIIRTPRVVVKWKRDNLWSMLMKDNAGKNEVVDVDFIQGAGIWIAHPLIGHGRIWILSSMSINLKIETYFFRFHQTS